MDSRKTYFSFKKFSSLLFFTFLGASLLLIISSSNVAAASERLGKDESVAIAAKGLSSKLRADLVLKDVAVKLGKSQQYTASANQVGLKGQGIVRLDGEVNDLPIAFDIKIDANNRSAVDVKYVFLNMEGANDAGATVAVEDVVTQKLLQKIKSDYKSQNIVVAIDYINEQTFENGEAGFTGGGEVRMNGMIWKKIAFNVKGDKTNASIANYKIQ